MENQRNSKNRFKILIVEDDAEDIHLLKNFLVPKGYEVFESFNGEEALNKIKNSHPDIVILDWVLPGMPGIDVCREIRINFPNIYVIMLSQHKESEYKIKAFRTGSDDYLTKPCELQELEIRIKNLINKPTISFIGEKVMQFKNIIVDFSKKKVTRSGRQVELNDKEYSLLAYLLRNANKIITRNMILEEIWGSDTETFMNIVDIYINYLRKKLDEADQESFIKTVHGIGYMLEVPKRKTA